MVMIGSLIDQFVRIRIERLAVHPFKISARLGVPEVADHCVDEEKFAVLVPVRAPRIGGALRDQFKSSSRRMIAPDAGVEPEAIGAGRSRFADEARRLNSVA